jgi:hypothetical protein
VRWELELSGNPDQGMAEILRSQWAEANELFSRFVEKNYVDWVNNKGNDVPMQSHKSSRRRWPR